MARTLPTSLCHPLLCPRLCLLERGIFTLCLHLSCPLPSLPSSLPLPRSPVATISVSRGTFVRLSEWVSLLLQPAAHPTPSPLFPAHLLQS